MGVASYVELARTFENELGGSPKAVRTWAVTLTNDTLENSPTTHLQVINAIGINAYGASHPDITNPYFGLRKVTVTERFQDSPYHIQVIGEYGVVSANELLTPLSRASEWAFESKPSQVPAFFYWETANTKRPLTNSAFDYYEGLQTEELIVVAKITKNYADFDVAGGPQTLVNATNAINDAAYLGGAIHTWKVAGVQTSYVTEIYNNVSYQYWKTTSEIHFRESTWNLLLPDVGWNFIANGQKRRAMVFDFQNAEWIASPNPVGLNGSGGLSTAAFPDINERRVNRTVNFASLFGYPPTVSPPPQS